MVCEGVNWGEVRVRDWGGGAGGGRVGGGGKIYSRGGVEHYNID